MPTFHTPTTSHVANDVLGSTEVNNIGDSLNFLLAGIHASGKYDKGSDITTTSTSFAAIDSSNLAKTVTLTGTKALLIFRGVILPSTTVMAGLDINVNGTRWSSTGVNGSYGFKGSSIIIPGSCFSVLVDGLTPGSNTFQILWMSASAQTLTLYAGAGSGGTDFIPSLDIVAW